MTRPTRKIARNQYLRAALVGVGVYLAVSIVAGYVLIGTATNMGIVGVIAGMAVSGKVAGAASVREWAFAGLLTFVFVLVAAYVFVALMQFAR